ncbi:protein flightless-1 [Danaus plexippus]|uniref:Flightless-1 n=1 Tax=Danaus plexippus plexippus TaxID=278856 RepID=A0A212ENC8_DANPL|nr:protein flightless-1 [Danaus plexippus]OWR42979.1 flightless-1 [Danaus plexippus plexippus]
MANTGLLPFVRGVDFTCNDFSGDKFPDAIRYMTGLQWLRLDKTNLEEIPEELGKLMKLENLSLKKNNLEKLFGELTELKCLRSLNVRHNNVKTSGIPAELFRLDDLTTLDLSHNRLKEVPEGLEKAKSLLVLNLSHNKIESIPPTLFVQLTDLLFLDLSSNLLETLPPQTRRLANLQTLILNDNPLGLFQLRQLPSLQSLETLHMRNTQRTLANLPTSLEPLINLSDVDLSKNALTKVPDALYTLQNIKRLNLSENEITEISTAMDIWQKLESLNLSRNKLTTLPATLCKLQSLRRLHVDDNKLDFEGIPSGIGKLGNLEVFSAANNLLEMIPEGLCRCGSLKKLNLSSNKLITLPDAIHLLSDLESLQLHGNPDLVMPPKPVERARGAGLQYYNIDFSLQTQLQLAGAATPELADNNSISKSDPIARKLRLRRRGETDNSDVILRGMQEQANTQHATSNDEMPHSELKPKRWDESLEKPPLDYSEFFDEDTGQAPGLQIWEIENFIPAPVDEVAHGKFFEGDCYIVLKTSIEEQGQLSWDIHFWIGSKATLDKGACAAMHAVNLRNLLGAKRTQRHEQGDESPEFLALFPTPPVYINGSRTPSGFFTVDDPHYVTRLYRVHGAGSSIHLEPSPVSASSLDPRYVFVLDTGLRIHLWNGKKAKNTLKSKARLFAEKINKEERKNKAELIAEVPGKESKNFWQVLGYEDDMPYVAEEHVPDNFTWSPARLYRVELGMGYLELPQTEGPLTRTILATRNVYILDAHQDLFVWFGKKSSRLVRAAAVKLAQELFSMAPREPHALVTRLQEGTETQVFKTYFQGWEEVIAVDFTRTAESVARTGADLTSWARQQETKTDLSALFTPRQPAMSPTEAKSLADEWNEDLEAMEAFVLEGRHFVRLPDQELGVFYSCDCYVFLCRYVLPVEADDDTPEADEVDSESDSVTWVVYFWQGRRAPNMGWLTFTFGLERKFKQLCKRLDVVRTHQQQESLKFMAHFRRRFIIRDGKRNLKPEGRPPVELFELRSNGSSLCTRLVQVKPDASVLNSAFCYILNVPLEGSKEESSAIVYAWIGSKSDADSARLIELIANEKFNNDFVSLQVLTEGSEPDNFFWVALGGRKPYDEDAEYLNYTRLFRCSNEKGYFTVSEKWTDFCQDDLADDDIMILDNGEQVFLWLGARCSEVEIKLAYKSAQVYIQHMKTTQPDRPRKLFLTLKDKESRRFTKCFHGWGEHKKPPE